MSESELPVERNSVNQVFSKYTKKSDEIKRASILKYNSDHPESAAERILLPKEAKKGRIRKPLSDDNEVDFTALDPEIMKKVDNSDFWIYCEKKVKKRKIWGKTLKTDMILSYSKSISGPILKLDKVMSSMAKKNFKRIVYIINNKLSKQGAINLMKRMIKMGVKNSAEFRDEFFFQLIKQVRGNTRQECCYQAWMLMGVISCYLCPSESSIFYLLNYVKYVAINHPDDEIKQWARFIFMRFWKGFYLKGRAVLPCTSEIECIKERKKLTARIRMCTGGYVDVYFENYMTVRDIIEQICEKMEIPKEYWTRFGLYEITIKPDKREETFVEEFNKLADVLASWEHEENFYTKKLSVPFSARFELYFKIRFFFQLDITNFLELQLIYNEACFLFKFCHCDMSLIQLEELMSLHLQIVFGNYDYDKGTEIKQYLYRQIPAYECKFLTTEDNLVNDILKGYSQHTGMDRNEGKKKFSEYFLSKDCFGHNFYRSKADSHKNIQGWEMPDTFNIGLAQDHMTFFDLGYNKIISIPYQRFWKWGFSDVLFSFLFGKEASEGEEEVPTKIVVQTTLGTCLSYTMHSYADIILGISPKDNQLAASATSKMIIDAKSFFKRVNTYEIYKISKMDENEEDLAVDDALNDMKSDLNK